MAEYPLWAAVRTIREGISGTAGLAAYRDAGGQVRTSTWFRLLGEAQAAIGGRADELARPQHRRPLADETHRWTTRTTRGMLQQVEVFVRDRATGIIGVVPYSHRSQAGVSRQAAIAAALEFMANNADAYNQQVLGAIHVASYLMEPADLE